MSLEQKIEALTAAVEALTAVMKVGGTAAAPAPAPKKEAAAPAPAPVAEKPKAAAYEAKHSREEMQAALAEVKERLGTPAAKSIIKDIGKVEKMAEITDAKLIDACYEAAKAKLQEADDAM